jgi:hypothetical protein
MTARAVRCHRRPHEEGVMQVPDSSDPAATLARGRRRRWWMLGTAGVLLLVGYVVALAWVTQRLQVDVQNSIRPLQALQAGHSGG